MSQTANEFRNAILDLLNAYRHALRQPESATLYFKLEAFLHDIEQTVPDQTLPVISGEITQLPLSPTQIPYNALTTISEGQMEEASCDTHVNREPEEFLQAFQDAVECIPQENNDPLSQSVPLSIIMIPEETDEEADDRRYLAYTFNAEGRTAYLRNVQRTIGRVEPNEQEDTSWFDQRRDMTEDSQN